MSERILVTGKKISSMELVTNVTGFEKIPTGQPDDLAIIPNQLADYTIARGSLVNRDDLLLVESDLGTQVLDLVSDLAAEEAARIAADNLKVDKEGSVSSVAGRVGDVVLAPSDVLVEGFGSQEDVNKYVPKTFLSGYTYGLGERVVLNDGEVVKSTVEGNVINPNGSMVGWVSVVSDSLATTVQTFNTPEAGVDPVTGVANGAYFNARSEDVDTSAVEYQNVGGSAVATGKRYLSAPDVVAVDSIADLLALPEGQRREGLRYLVKGYYAGSDVGGGEFYYNPERSGDNDGGIVLNGFIRVIVGPLSPAHFGATVSETPQNQAIQAALSNYHHVQIDEPYWVDATNRLSMSSNQIVDFVGDGKLMALPNSAGSYSILALRNIENSTLNHPVIQGDKYTHTGTTGEWGNCLDIRSVKNVTVNNPVLTDAWGDCLYIGRNDFPSENLVINNPICQRGRRQGISLIAGVGVTINKPVCEDIRSDDSAYPLAGGPHAGIDIEPNTYLDRLEDIKIIDPTTRRCEGIGLLVAITAITQDQPENHIANVGINVVRHVDEGSVGGGRVANHASGRLKGYVIFDSPTYLNNMRSALILRMPDKSVKVTVVRPVIIDHNRIGGTSSNYDTAIFVGIVDQSYDGDMGGMHIINPKIVVNTPTATPMYGITVRNVNHPNRVIGVDIEDIEYSGDESLTNYVTHVTRGLFTSKDNSLYIRPGASTALTDSIGLYAESASETVTPTFTLTNRPYGYPDQHVRRTSLTQRVNVNKPAEGTLRDMDGTLLNGLRALSQYAYVQLRPLGDGAWVVVSRYGSWEILAEAGPAVTIVPYNPPSLTNGTQQATTVTLTGAKLGDNINVSFDKPLSGTRMWGEVTSVNTVTVYHRNDTGADVDVASGTLKVKLV